MKKIVIIGGVAGGASCGARLRRLQEEDEIILFERGDHISYANCGLPYHVGDVIPAKDSLLLQTPEAMREKFNIDVRIRNEVTAIHRDKKTVTILDHNTNREYEESYDTLVIATGSSPLRPAIPGIASSRIHTIWTIQDTERIRASIQQEETTSVAVVGGGFIGLEMAENLRHVGVSVTLIEASDQVMAPIDHEMAQMLHQTIEKHGVALHLQDGVASFMEQEDGIQITLNSGKTLFVDHVILAIGVRPNSELAKAAGLQVNARGGICVDPYLKTSDASIYAVGDVIEVDDYIFKDKTMIPLAGPANKQGRIVANNIHGKKETYTGTQGTSIAKVFDLSVASTGANEKMLKKHGYEKGKDYESIIITQNSHAGYYPGARPLTIKLLFSCDGKKLYGAQILGQEGVDKRIDVLATLIRMHGDVDALKQLELAYAPPFSSAKDPVNMAGFVADNVLQGLVQFAHHDLSQENQDVQLLDVREAAEVRSYAIAHAHHIPLKELRNRLHELDKDKEVIVFCAIGVRAYNAARILQEHGFSRVKIYPSGAYFYQIVNHKKV